MDAPDSQANAGPSGGSPSQDDRPRRAKRQPVRLAVLFASAVAAYFALFPLVGSALSPVVRAELPGGV